jgi:hypothetical protein
MKGKERMEEKSRSTLPVRPILIIIMEVIITFLGMK